MQYNFHNEKYKSEDVVGIHKEQFREYKDESKYKNYVDDEKTKENVYMELSPNGKDWHQRIKEAKASTEEKTGKAVRKDAVVLCSTVETVPSSWRPDICNQYFEDKARWYDNYLQEMAGVDADCMLSVCVHHDESNPHATYVWIPEREGKLQAKNIVNQTFLKRLQMDSQSYTMGWIDTYNLEHEAQIEKLEPAVAESQRKHLNEFEYKEQKIQEHIEELSLQKESITNELGEAKNEFQTVKEATTAERKLISVERQEVEAKRLENEQKEKVIVSLTQSPDLESYQDVIEENEQLKEELSIKDKLIQTLREKTANLQEKLQEAKEVSEKWKETFENIYHKAGKKLMKAFGYEINDSERFNQYPTTDVSDALQEIKEETQGIEETNLRVIVDHDNMTYKVVNRIGVGEYNIVKEDFASREDAEEWKRDFTKGIESLNRDEKNQEQQQYTIRK